MSRRNAFAVCGVALGAALVAASALRILAGTRVRTQGSYQTVGPHVRDQSSENPDAGPSATPFATEPAHSPPKTHDPALAGLVDRGAECRVFSDMTARCPVVRFPQDIAALVPVLKDPNDDLVVRQEVAQLLIRSSYEGLVSDVVDILDNPEETPTFRAFCVQYLWQYGGKARSEERQRILALLWQCLEDEQIPVRREALLALLRMRDPKAKEAAARCLLDERAEAVRDIAIRCVRELDLREHVPTIRKYLRDENDVVRIAAIVTLSQWGDEESREVIKEATKSKSFRLRRCAEMALKRLDRPAKAKRETEPAKNTPAVPSKGTKEEAPF